MRRLPRILGLSLLALSLSWPALAEPPRSIKIGVLNDASGPYSDNAGEGSVGAAAFRPLDEGGCSLTEPSKNN
jgi:branched-chain amino acid transport system substrate-binding protein